MCFSKQFFNKSCEITTAGMVRAHYCASRDSGHSLVCQDEGTLRHRMASEDPTGRNQNIETLPQLPVPELAGPQASKSRSQALTQQ